MVDLATLTPEQHLARREVIVRALAQTLASGTAGELANSGRPPAVHVEHDYELEPVLEGATLQATVTVSNGTRTEISVPGEQAPRAHVPGEPVVFQARESGSIVVRSWNVLNPRHTIATSAMIHVVRVPTVNPYTFDGIDIRGLTGTQVGALAEALGAARADGLELDPWAAGRAVLELSDAQRDAIANELTSLDDLLTTLQNRVGEAATMLALSHDGNGEALVMRTRAEPPSILHLMRGMGPIARESAERATEVVLSTWTQPSLDDLRVDADAAARAFEAQLPLGDPRTHADEGARGE